MSTIIQCPNCETRYRLKFTIENGQQVRCPACQTVWRFQAEPEAEEALPLSADEPDHAEAGVNARAPDDERAQQGADPSHASYDDEHANYQSGAVEDAVTDRDEAPSYQAAYAGFAAAPEVDEAEELAAEAPQAAQPQTAAAWGSLDTGADLEFENSAVNYIRESSIAPLTPVGDEDARETTNWAAELAGAINRAGYERRDPMGSEYDQGDGDAKNAFEADAGALDTEQTDDENQRLAAEKLSAFWRGERAAAAFDENEYNSFGGGMPVKQPQEMEPRPRGSLAIAAAWASYIAVVGGAIAAVALFPEHVVNAIPGAATYYEQLGVSVVREPLGFENVTYAWLSRDGKSVLEVRGEVINLTEGSVRVPLLHISVRDDQLAEIAKTVAIILKDPLGPSAKTPFMLEFLSPPKSISGIELQFGS